jgi:uncharacterized membrane protein
MDTPFQVNFTVNGASRDEDMMVLMSGLLIFILVHLVPTQGELRSGLVTRFGDGAYKAAFSIVSLVGLALIGVGYGKLQVMPGKNPQIWAPPVWTHHITFLLMIPAMILLVAAYVPSRIRTAVRHPMLAAIKLWAFAHLIANGDLGSMVLFGSGLAYAAFDRISVKRRAAPGPLGSRAGGVAGDLIAMMGGLALYAFMMLWATPT